MKMKKMLAILAALSVLGTTGLTVGAEDMATTTEPATEAITTTETEAETTAAETTAETETTVETDVTEETAATEENQVVGKQIINKGDVLTFNGTLSYANGKNRPILNLDTPIEATVGGVDETVTYVRLNEESLTYADGTKLTVTGTVDLTAFAGTGQNVVFLSNNTITENNATTTTTAAETTTTTTTTTTEATDAIIDQKTETIIAQGKPHTLQFVLFKDTYGNGYCVSIYVDGKLAISRQPVGYFEYNPTSVSSYAGLMRGSVLEITVTDWGESTTTPTTTSFHYQYDPVQGTLINSSGHVEEDSETTAAKEALYNKFVAAYGKPTYTNYGDFDQDGELDAYFVYYDSTGVNTYFVTKDSITLVDKNTGDSMWSSDFAYFTCNGYRFRANLHTRIPVAYATGYITIERIEADGSLTKVNFNETVLQDSFAVDHNPNYTADLREDLANKVSSYFSCNGDKITVTHYLYENGRDVGSNSYVYDEATNSFVKAGNTTPDDDNNQQKPLEIHLGDTMTVTGTLHYELETAYENNHKQVVLKLDKPITVTYMDEMENGFGSVKAGMTEVVDSVQISLDDKLPEGTHLTVTGNVMYGHTGHHIRHIVLNNCTYRLDGKTDDGKTDNGSASNAPATKNTSGTPKTGDITTVPAVAVGLTLTAAGVVAFISKRKK
ncbi:MAG: LPXTG cell wall anchor domain-containing protein [Ruminococcus sp.]|nr:LPXTG cell wall anchor domain-containing protein [Ruminococcus sp.]